MNEMMRLEPYKNPDTRFKKSIKKKMLLLPFATHLHLLYTRRVTQAMVMTSVGSSCSSIGGSCSGVMLVHQRGRELPKEERNCITTKSQARRREKRRNERRTELGSKRLM